MNKLSIEKRTQIIASLVEGNSINSSCRITRASKNTVLKLLAEVGNACALYQDRVMTGLTCKKVQCDEIWSFVGYKEKHVPEELKGALGIGDVYIWTAIDADTKLVPCWHVGNRDAVSASLFIDDLAARLVDRIQLNTDGHKVYLNSVEEAFAREIDYAMLVRMYGNDVPAKEASPRYNPCGSTGAEKTSVIGNSKGEDFSTSYVERQNLTMRMHMRRAPRLTNAVGKKLENHMHAVSLHFMYYNFCRIHKTLSVTPAMKAGITDHAWSIEEVLMMVETARKNVVTVEASN